MRPVQRSAWVKVPNAGFHVFADRFVLEQLGLQHSENRPRLSFISHILNCESYLFVLRADA